MAADAIKLTKAEEDALRYLTTEGRTEWYPSALASLYRQRYEDELRADGRVPYVGSGREGAWRRTSGAVMARLRRKGVMRHAWGRYARSERLELTEAGLALAAALGDSNEVAR